MLRRRKRLPTRRRVKRRKTVTPKVLRTNPDLSAEWASLLEDDRLTKMQGWLDLIEQPERDGPYNFGIRDYRLLEPDDGRSIVEAVASIIRVALIERSAGIQWFDHH